MSHFLLIKQVYNGIQFNLKRLNNEWYISTKKLYTLTKPSKTWVDDGLKRYASLKDNKPIFLQEHLRNGVKLSVI